MAIEDYIGKIINADCMDILKQLPDKCIDAIICDLPYGTTACSWDVVIPFDKLWEQYKRIRKDNCPIVLFGSEPFSTYLRMSNIKEYRYDWYWIKDKGSDPLNCNKRPLNNIENVIVFYKNQSKYNPQMLKGEPYKKINKNCKLGIHLQDKKIVATDTFNDGFRFPLRDLYFARDTSKGYSLHPTQKPIDLIEYLIKTYSNEGDLILDNCSGSGSLAIACHNLKRRFICIEKDYDYWKASVERLKNAQAQMRLDLEF